MKASQLAKYLNDVIPQFGDPELFVEAEFEGRRSHQALHDLLCSESQFVLVSKQAMDADPLNSLPIIESDEPVQH